MNLNRNPTKRNAFTTAVLVVVTAIVLFLIGFVVFTFHYGGGL